MTTARSRLAPLAVALALAGLPLGCESPRDRPIGREIDHPSMPRSWQDARWLEEQGLDKIDLADRTRAVPRRRELFDDALRYFRDARQLYVDELTHDPGPPERERNLEQEIERLSELIEETHRARPIGG